ncbi:P-loop containing nucleoside triphosphate hydrolase protein [Nemania serpens]|nr:P-loop containing nucleoside triphosphate hydrolase protein [Nemania serpens]
MPATLGPWIKYRVEHRHRETDELISHADGEEPALNDTLSDDGSNPPAFIFVTTYKTGGLSSPKVRQSSAQSTITSPPLYSLHLISPAIVNALRSVVQYYPSQDLTGDIVIHWPYAILVHHYDELAQFRDEVGHKDERDLCEREKSLHGDLGLLLQYLDRSVMEEVRKEQERNKRGFNTFDYRWVALKPGTTVLDEFRDQTELRPYVIHSIEGGTFESPPVPWSISRWYLRYDGRYLGRCMRDVIYDKFDGENQQFEIIVGDLENNDNHPDAVLNQLKYGESYWSLIQKQCKQYNGKTQDVIPKEVDGLVMVDMKFYHASYRIPLANMVNTADCRNWTSDCNCEVCKRAITDDKGRISMISLFEDYSDIAPESRTTLTPHQYFLCHFEVPAFVFKTRTWEILHVRDFAEPKFDENLINFLVMEPQRKRTLKALAKSFARIDKNEKQLKGEPWAADFVQGKGHGLIFLLHGQQCIAAFTKRPLMVLTSSDIGTDPKSIEVNLTRNFKTAKSWGAVLLIDEADVFMERRSTADLVRNSLVAGFLRALEFYDGILFLTTNRVGSFDDAFISRVHVQLYYPDFNEDQRQQIWQTFVDKLAKERSDSMRLNLNAKEYIRGNDIRSLKLNGREIRNAFQTAVSLAEYDAEKGEDGKVIVTDDHLRAVVELSRDFKTYLGELHRGDEAKRAERNYERLDSYTHS